MKYICSAARQIHCICDLYIYLPRGRAAALTVARQSPASCLDDRAKRCNKLVDRLTSAQLLSAYAVTSRQTTKESTMSTMSKKAAREIASIVNSIMVSAEMARTASSETKGLWLDREAKMTIELFERFGIKLPAYDVLSTRVDLLR
jgi:hypothetical protein